MNTSRIGTAPRPITEKIVFHRAVGPTRATTNPAIASTKSTFPSSDGWNWITPRSSQRFEPRTASAATNTTTISASVAPYTSFQERRQKSIGISAIVDEPTTPTAAAKPCRTTK